ncbi:hypothetical protein T03_3677 [Trichinella britovi]|uniref:Uncharacterized protein n=1 Tax=Trichinella britovi TaxID=45882 RepID=A0A0V1CNC4_TRIBR|nr:hypothetical protein T03_3677 [Trichinella britovi]
MKRIWLKWYNKLMFSFISRRYCSSTESFQCKEKKQDGNALSRISTLSLNEQSTSQRPLKKLAIDLQGDITTVKIRGDYPSLRIGGRIHHILV